MKHFTISSLVIALALILSACGQQAAPTMNAADVQSTAVAAAFTMVAQTQAAIPTNTPVPPTDTPVPTDTPIALPTLDTLQATPTTAASVSSGNGTADPCAKRVLSWSPKGKSTVIRIANMTKAPITVSLYLNLTEGAGECGYRSYSLGKQADVVITDLVYGCYNLWAWGDAKNIHVNAGGYGCINNPDKWTFEVNQSSIKFTGP